MLARDLQQFRGKDAVVLCLQDSSLLTCLSLAMRLRAWVYPLIYVPVYASPLAGSKMLGAYNEESVFCQNPDLEVDGDGEITTEQQAIVESLKVGALDVIKQQMSSYEMSVDKHCLEGRDVIIIGDVVMSGLPFAVAAKLLEGIRPKSVTTIIGNATPAAAEAARMSAEKVTIMDVLCGPVYHEDHYFERPDEYNAEQKHILTKHVTAYWQ